MKTNDGDIKPWHTLRAPEPEDLSLEREEQRRLTEAQAAIDAEELVEEDNPLVAATRAAFFNAQAQAKRSSSNGSQAAPEPSKPKKKGLSQNDKPSDPQPKINTRAEIATEPQKPVGEKNTPAGKLTGRSLAEILASPPDPALTLLGRRYLCAGGGLVITGSSGLGKSTLATQAAILWAMGKPAFGITPARPLRTLILQAENDEGDMWEMVEGVTRKVMGADEIASLSGKIVVADRPPGGTPRGPEFAAYLASWLEGGEPFGLVIADPLLAYYGSTRGGLEGTEGASEFLRHHVEPVLARTGAAIAFVHHTTKLGKGAGDLRSLQEYTYAGAGSAEVINWARANLHVERTEAAEVCRLVAAKRGERIGWEDEDGEPQRIRHYRHTEGSMWWEEVPTLEAEDLIEDAKREARPERSKPDPKRTIWDVLPPTGTMDKEKVVERASSPDRGAARIGQNAARKTITEMLALADGEPFKIYQGEVPRAGTNPKRTLSRQPTPTDLLGEDLEE